MQHEWKVGDRAKVASSTAYGINFGTSDLGAVFTVERLNYDTLHGDLQLEGHADTPRRFGVYAARCKPVIRVPAITRPEPETYAELRQAHGPSRYQTGHDVFHTWNPQETVLSALSDTSGRITK